MGNPGFSHNLQQCWTHWRQSHGAHTPITARDLTDALNKKSPQQYPIQTVLTVLNRWVKRGWVHKQAHPQTNRLGFVWLGQGHTAESLRTHTLHQWLQPWINTHCHGDAQLALYTIQQALLAQIHSGGSNSGR